MSYGYNFLSEVEWTDLEKKENSGFRIRGVRVIEMFDFGRLPVELRVLRQYAFKNLPLEHPVERARELPLRFRHTDQVGKLRNNPTSVRSCSTNKPQTIFVLPRQSQCLLKSHANGAAAGPAAQPTSTNASQQPSPSNKHNRPETSRNASNPANRSFS